MKLHDLNPNPGSKKERKRVGRGISAGQGKTAGRGTKGAGSRSGEQGHLYRQGGNLPFYRRLPFIRGEGFTPPFQVEYNEVNLDQLSNAFDANAEVTPELLTVCACCVTHAIRSLFLAAVLSISRSKCVPIVFRLAQKARSSCGWDRRNHRRLILLRRPDL